MRCGTALCTFVLGMEEDALKQWKDNEVGDEALPFLHISCCAHSVFQTCYQHRTTASTVIGNMQAFNEQWFGDLSHEWV